MFALDRFVPVPRRRLARSRRFGSPPRRHWPGRRLERLRTVLPALCAIGIAAVAGWILAGGNLPSGEILFGQSESVAVANSSGAPVHIDSSPPGAQVRIDTRSSGRTPLDVRLEAGQHTLSLKAPDVLDHEESIQVAETGATVDIGLWRKRPDVAAVRPVYPGASLLDARFLNDGQVALLVGLPTQAGAPTAHRQLWRLDPSTGQLTPVRIPGLDPSAMTMVLSPDGDLVAYVTPNSSPAVTPTGWSTSTVATARPQHSQSESVWVAPLDGGQPARRVFEFPSASTFATTADPEHIVDLAWTPDGSRLIPITRQTGPPARARVFLVDVPPPGAADSQAGAADELVLLPTEVLQDSAAPDPSGRWLALVTHATVAPGGNNLLSLCVLQLQPGGSFRDVADLGSAATAIALAAQPVAWPSTAVQD
ncbi:MAG: PEGA domain-containing protein, partial [Chloroflexota bacterium]|nr:PEGA domain-containing protein [Chloroflexota bacterium]